MSSPRFDAFRSAAAEHGEDAVEAFTDFVRERGRGQPLLPQRIALDTKLERATVEELCDLAAQPELAVLSETTVVRCPHCDAYERLDDLEEEAQDEGSASCSACGHEIDDPSALRSEKRYELTPDAAAEAEEWQERKRAKPRKKALLLTAIPLELGIVKKHFERVGRITDTKTRTAGAVYYVGTFEGDHFDWEIALGNTQASEGQAAVGASDATRDWEPDVAIFVGVAGGILDKGVKLGDVVAADVVVNYERGKDEEEFIARPDPAHADFALTQAATFVKTDDTWRDEIEEVVPGLTESPPVVHLEPIAAGEKVVASKKSATYERIRQVADRAVAVETEGSGFMSALHRRVGVAAIVIRGISDPCEGKDEADAKGWQQQATANAAAFVFELLRSLDQPGDG